MSDARGANVSPLDVFTVTPPALQACLEVLSDVTPEEAASPTPCDDFTVGQVIDHLHMAMVRWAARADLTLDADDGLDSLVTATLAAWRARGLEGTLDIRGPISARRAADIIPLELVVHGWDVGTAVGHPIVVDDEIVAYLLDAAHDIVPTRRGVAFGAEITPPPDATPLERLVAFTGRAVP